MRILEECGLVVIEKHGRERHCTASYMALQEVAQWAIQYQSFWNRRLDTLENLLNEE